MITQQARLYRITTEKFTCGIEVINGIITKTAPLLKAFRYKHISKLMDWLDEYYMDSYKIEALSHD